MDEQQALITLDIIYKYTNINNMSNTGILRLLNHGIHNLYNNHIKYIKNIYNKAGFLHYVNTHNKYSFSINKGILFFIVNTEPIYFILQLNIGHPFYPPYSYLYKPLIHTKSYIYKILMSYLKNTHEDIVLYILSFIPNYILLHTKIYALKNKYLNEALDIDNIENGNTWGPTYNASGLNIVINKYLSILNNMGINIK